MGRNIARGRGGGWFPGNSGFQRQWGPCTRDAQCLKRLWPWARACTRTAQTQTRHDFSTVEGKWAWSHTEAKKLSATDGCWERENLFSSVERHWVYQSHSVVSWVWTQEQSANTQRSHSVVVVVVPKRAKAQAVGKVQRWGRAWEELREGEAYDPSIFCEILEENIEAQTFHPQNNIKYIISEYLSNNICTK